MFNIALNLFWSVITDLHQEAVEAVHFKHSIDRNRILG